MQRSYIDYAMSVIVGRALPDVRDGLKPVHRKILYGMYDSGYRPVWASGPDRPEAGGRRPEAGSRSTRPLYLWISQLPKYPSTSKTR
jgi:hypothetical protein